MIDKLHELMTTSCIALKKDDLTMTALYIENESFYLSGSKRSNKYDEYEECCVTEITMRDVIKILKGIKTDENII
jgi:hypothetical protein